MVVIFYNIYLVLVLERSATVQSAGSRENVRKVLQTHPRLAGSVVPEGRGGG